MFGQRLDPDLRLGLGGLMRHGRDDALDQLPGVDPHRLELAPAFAGEVEDRADQPVHLADRGLDEAERLGEVLRQLLVGAVEHGSAVSVAFSGAWARRLGAAQRCDPAEDVVAQLLQLAGEAHDVDQRRAQIVADDIGEALDLVVGFAQVGGALLDRGFEVEIVVAQPGLGLVARARGTPHQEDRNAGQHHHQPGAGVVTTTPAAWLRSAARCAPRTGGVLRPTWPARCSRILSAGVAALRLRCTMAVARRRHHPDGRRPTPA